MASRVRALIGSPSEVVSFSEDNTVVAKQTVSNTTKGQPRAYFVNDVHPKALILDVLRYEKRHVSLDYILDQIQETYKLEPQEIKPGSALYNKITSKLFYLNRRREVKSKHLIGNKRILTYKLNVAD